MNTGHVLLHRNSDDVAGNDTKLDVTIYNGRTNQLYAYVTALDPDNGAYYVLYNGSDSSFFWKVKPDGNTSVPYYYTLEDTNYEIQLPPGENTSLFLPSYAASGRIYVAEEQLAFGTVGGGPNSGFVQPSVSNPGLSEYNISFSFMEFTYLEGNFYADISSVDSVSVPLGIRVVSETGLTTTVYGLIPNATESVCEGLEKQTLNDQYNWSKLCVRAGDKLIRVLSPSQYLAMNPTDNLSTYYDVYIEEVWETFTTVDLRIDTQDSSSSDPDGLSVENSTVVTCNISADEQLVCRRGNNDYIFGKPTTVQVFGCTQELGSPFHVNGSNIDRTQAEIVPRLCAAFQRSTLLIFHGQLQPNANVTAEQYYKVKHTNHYARLVHENQYGGMGYAFPYDDTNPTGSDLDNATANAAGVIRDSNPKLLYLVVGK
ncbi:family 64 glycoside hydrolase [Cryphonectria parasitica EP155]|uniref:Family 64 glycoside hydrolase n=1 Tax=Cryphonectria parasitica (strain ATCC 38755 / EP155) TaxID=660469 RepID=A0A9P4XUJ7_CRYP1|nr:family 64 glycoside hydrolase [Cryphonectria parasitica EP155]KAF3761249.1 family 64 glycoside hydrolase [Cryphonectria parasitica EP155]